MGSQTRKTRKTDIILYGIGIIILAYSAILSTDDKLMALFMLLAYVPLFIFARYLQNHGGMGWKWPD
jgi:hypothetical protein